MKNKTETTFGSFILYLGKVLLPVFLGSLVFSGILAKYNNEMNLNKFIVESAYQPMKQQYRECNKVHGDFRRQLTHYRASVVSLQESIQHGFLPPASFWKQLENPNFNSFISLEEVEMAWENVMECYGTFTSHMDDLSLMLGEDGVELTDVVNKRDQGLDPLKIKKQGIFKKLYPLELEGLFAEARESSVNKSKAIKKEWVNKLEIVEDGLKKLDDMAVDASKGQDDYFDESNEVAIKVLKKRFETGPFEFLTNLTH